MGKHRPAVKNTQSDRAQDRTSETERLRQTREWWGVAGKRAYESESEVNRMRKEIMEDREKMGAKFTAAVGEVGRLAPALPPGAAQECGCLMFTRRSAVL